MQRLSLFFLVVLFMTTFVGATHAQDLPELDCHSETAAYWEYWSYYYNTNHMPEEGLATYECYTQLNPEGYNPYMEAQLRYQLGQIDEAFALIYDQENPETLEQRLCDWSVSIHGFTYESLPVCEAALEVEDTDADFVYDIIGGIHEHEGNFDAAIEAYQKVVELRGGPWDYLDLADTMAKTGRFQEGIDLLNSQLPREDGLTDYFLVRRGGIYLNWAIAESNQEAAMQSAIDSSTVIANQDECVGLTPMVATLLHAKAMVALGEVEAAVEWFKNQNCGYDSTIEAELWLLGGETETAIQLLDFLEPQSAQDMRRLAFLYEQAGETAKRDEWVSNSQLQQQIELEAEIGNPEPPFPADQ